MARRDERCDFLDHIVALESVVGAEARPNGVLTQAVSNFPLGGELGSERTE